MSTKIEGFLLENRLGSLKKNKLGEKLILKVFLLLTVNDIKLRILG